jgi:hypothetical protein
MPRHRRFFILALVLAMLAIGRSSDAYVLIVHDIVLGIQFVVQNEQVQQIWTQVDNARRLWRRLSSALSTPRIAAYTVPETRWREYRGADDDPLNAYTPLRLALINGDPDASGYREIVPAPPIYPGPAAATLSDANRERVAAIDRTVRLIDGYSQLAVDQIATNRTAGKTTNRALTAIDDDWRGRTTGSVALMQDIAGARLAGAHDGQMRSITLAYLLESELVEQILARDSEALHLRADLEKRSAFPEVARQSRAGTTEVLRDWRLP